MSIATKTGDTGTTALLYNRRVSKTHPRVGAYGAVDSLNSALGLCRAHSPCAQQRAYLLARQRELVLIMAELATDDADAERFLGRKTKNPEQPAHLEDAHLEPLDAMIARCEKDAPPFTDWIMPGDTPLQAYFDLARTTCRTTERQLWQLAEGGALVRPLLPRYLNRLSDVLWLLGRDAAASPAG